MSPEFDHDFAFHLGLTKPVIAVINGPAAGVGLVLACYCDLRFAAAGAKLTTAHGKLNLPAEYGLSWLLPRLIGLGRANDLLLSSRVVLAEEALEMGLVNAVVDRDDLLDHSRRYAEDLAAHRVGRVARRHQAPDRARPAPRRGCGRGRVGRAHGPDDGRARLRRRRGRAPREAPAELLTSAGAGSGRWVCGPPRRTAGRHIVTRYCWVWPARPPDPKRVSARESPTGPCSTSASGLALPVVVVGPGGGLVGAAYVAASTSSSDGCGRPTTATWRSWPSSSPSAPPSR